MGLCVSDRWDQVMCGFELWYSRSPFFPEVWIRVSLRLRETLMEALSKDAPTTIDMDTPADKALKLIDKILTGEGVRNKAVVYQGPANFLIPSPMRLLLRPVNLNKFTHSQSLIVDHVLPS